MSTVYSDKQMSSNRCERGRGKAGGLGRLASFGQPRHSCTGSVLWTPFSTDDNQLPPPFGMIRISLMPEELLSL